MTTGHPETLRVTVAQGMSAHKRQMIGLICVHFRIYTKEKPLNVTYGIGLSQQCACVIH